jgi:hypothetical protein
MYGGVSYINTQYLISIIDNLPLSGIASSNNREKYQSHQNDEGENRHSAAAGKANACSKQRLLL